MLVRLEKCRQPDHAGSFAIIFGRSLGTVTSRGRLTLRAISGLMPIAIGSTKLGFYPGMPVHDLGAEMVQFASAAVTARSTTAREVRLKLAVGDGEPHTVLGWWRSLGQEERFMLWGRFEQNG
jgi:hypothetical protein